MTVRKGKIIPPSPTRALHKPKLESFAQAMALHPCQADAAKYAGCNGSRAALSVRGNELMKKPGVRERIDYLKTQSSKAAVVYASLSKGYVLQNLRKVVSMGLGEAPTPSQGGEPVYTTDLSAANRALELLGKEIGMFVDRKLHGVFDLRTATAEQVMEFLDNLDTEMKLLNAGPSTGSEELISQTIDNETAIDTTLTPAKSDT